MEIGVGDSKLLDGLVLELHLHLGLLDTGDVGTALGQGNHPGDGFGIAHQAGQIQIGKANGLDGLNDRCIAGDADGRRLNVDGHIVHRGAAAINHRDLQRYILEHGYRQRHLNFRNVGGDFRALNDIAVQIHQGIRQAGGDGLIHIFPLEGDHGVIHIVDQLSGAFDDNFAHILGDPLGQIPGHHLHIGDDLHRHGLLGQLIQGNGDLGGTLPGEGDALVGNRGGQRDIAHIIREGKLRGAAQAGDVDLHLQLHLVVQELIELGVFSVKGQRHARGHIALGDDEVVVLPENVLPGEDHRDIVKGLIALGILHRDNIDPNSHGNHQREKHGEPFFILHWIVPSSSRIV